MAIKSIEVICLPCPRCDQLKIKIVEIMKAIEQKNNIKIPYEFKHTPDLASVDRYSVSPSQAPIIVINGAVEFTGYTQLPALRLKLESLMKY